MKRALLALLLITSAAIAPACATSHKHDQLEADQLEALVRPHPAPAWIDTGKKCASCGVENHDSKVFRSTSCRPKRETYTSQDGTDYDVDIVYCDYECPRGHRWVDVFERRDVAAN